MGKHNGSKNKTDTKVLYKKSNITIRTHSRSCSDASQITKSGLLQIKKNLSKTANYYTDGDKVKRDLSVETGVCVLRRYYKSKHKRDKSTAQASSAKSKCSLKSEFAEFKPEHASGDSTNKFELIDPTTALNVDITSMMVENLKGLLNDWIRKHVLEDAQTKKKLIGVLDSILQCLDTKIASTHTSCCTYVLERNGEDYRVRNKKTETNSLTCQFCKQKQTSLIADTSSSLLFKKYSRFTIPFPYKHFRIISTLSIPRNMYKKEKNRKKQLVYKVRKMQKRDFATMNSKKDRKLVINVSSAGMSIAPSKINKKSLKIPEKKAPSKRRGIIFLPQMFYGSSTDITSNSVVAEKKNEETQENQLDIMPSLVKSIFADDPANITSTDKVQSNLNGNDKFTMTETNNANINTNKIINTVSNVQFHEAKYECCTRTSKTPNVTNQRFESRTKIDFINQSVEFPNLTITKQNSLIKLTQNERNIKPRKKFHKLPRKRKQLIGKVGPKSTKIKYESIKYKQFTYLYKKTNDRLVRDGDIFNHFRNIFKYFADQGGKRDVKLEIHCNVYPFIEMDENRSIANTDAYKEYEVNTFPTNIPASEISFKDLQKTTEQVIASPQLNSKIIPLLDGAASQAKYIFKSDNSSGTSNHSVKYSSNIEKGTLMTGLDVSKELQELRSAIRDFSATAEKLVVEHLNKQQHEASKDIVVVARSKLVEPSKVFNDDNKIAKLSSNSKGIQIPSSGRGQLLSGIKLSKGPKKTEDMSTRFKKRSSSYHVIESESILRVTDMTPSANKSKYSNARCVTKKSKSLLNIKEANKKNLMAFLGDTGRKENNDRFVYVCPGPQMKTSSCNNPCCKSRSKTSKVEVTPSLPERRSCNREYCSSLFAPESGSKPTFTVKKKRVVSTLEGCIYCILLWIPAIVVMVLFYNNVLKDLFEKKNSTSTGATKAPAGKRRPKLRLGSDFMDPSGTNSKVIMQPYNDVSDENQILKNRRPKSCNRFPKQMPSYIVAFAVHETYDDIATAQQMICNKRSLQSSTSCVSPALSSKTITIDNNSAPKLPDTEFIETPDELKNEVDEEGNDENENGDIQNELPETSDYLVVDNKGEDDVTQDNNTHVIESKQLKKQVNRLLKKKLQNHSRVKNVNFKYKKLLKNLESSNKKTACAAKFKESFYSNSVSKMVSRTSLLKSAVTKENILDTVDSIFSDEDNNNESLHSSPSTTKKSFISYSSDDTLTQKGSTSSKNDLNSLGTINSVIRIPSQRAIPYKTEVINVSVAVAYNPNENEYKPTPEPFRQMYDRDLVSTETLVDPNQILTSASGSSAASENVEDLYLQAMVNLTSDNTLKPDSGSTYVVGNTSSEVNSESTLAPTSETFMYAENLRQTPPATEKPENDKNYNRMALLDTVINMGFFPEINPSTSSGINYYDDLNNVIVTNGSGKIRKSPMYDKEVEENQKDRPIYETFKTLKKPFDANIHGNLIRNVNLPNESTIQAIINETSKIETKFWSGGSTNYPGNITELWDRLVLVVDAAVKRLEYSLTDKIINEIRTQLPNYGNQNNRTKEEMIAVVVDQPQGDRVSNKEVFVEKSKIITEADEGLQCTLVGNKVIDHIMMKMSVEDSKNPKILEPEIISFPKVNRPKIFKDFFEVLKPPTVESALVESKGDTVTVSTAVTSEIEEVDSLNRVKAMFSAPLTFLRENLLIVTSVPTFFVMLLCVYGIIVFILKPW